MVTLAQFVEERWSDAGRLPPKPAYVAHRDLTLRLEQQALVDFAKGLAHSYGSEIDAQTVMRLCRALHYCVLERMCRAIGESIGFMPGNHLPIVRTVFETAASFRAVDQVEPVAARKHWAHEHITTGRSRGRTYYAKADGTFALIDKDFSRYLDLDYRTALTAVFETALEAHPKGIDPTLSHSWAKLYSVVGSALDRLADTGAQLFIEPQSGVTLSFAELKNSAERYARVKGEAPAPQTMLEAFLTAQPNVFADEILSHIKSGTPPELYATQPVLMNVMHELQDSFARLAFWGDPSDRRETERWGRQLVIYEAIHSLPPQQTDGDLAKRVAHSLNQLLEPHGLLAEQPPRSKTATVGRRSATLALCRELLLDEHAWFCEAVEAVVSRDYAFLV